MENIKNKIMCSFDKKASSYDKYSLIQDEVAQRLCDRLSNITIKPVSILDIGCGTGYLSDMLFKLYPHANITCLDISLNMLEESHKKIRILTVYCLMLKICLLKIINLI